MLLTMKSSKSYYLDNKMHPNSNTNPLHVIFIGYYTVKHVSYSLSLVFSLNSYHSGS